MTDLPPSVTTADKLSPPPELEADADLDFPTSLDPQETTGSGFSPSLPDDPDLDHSRLCLTWRHSGWLHKRTLVYAAIKRTLQPERRVNAFENCGRNAWVLRHPGPPVRWAVRCECCHDRLCDPCSQARRSNLCRNLRLQLPKQPLRLITLTLKSSPAPLADVLDRLYAAWKDLKRHRDIKRRVTGGVAFLEITYRADTGQWHPHLHVIASGQYLPHQLLKDAWLSCTGDSFIVHVTLIRSPDDAARYVAKYATKTINASVWADADALCEFIRAIAGRRSIWTWGAWTRLRLTQLPEPEAGWEAVEQLWTLITRARGGDQEARRVLMLLTRSTDDAPLEPATRDGT